MAQDALPNATPLPGLLTAPRTPEQLRAALQRRCTFTLSLTLTDNRRTYLSFRGNRRSGLKVRLHRSFCCASEGVLDGVSAILKEPKHAPARATLRAFWQAQGAQEGTPPPPAARRPSRPGPIGAVYHLQRLLAEIALREGFGEPLPTIGWGRQSTRRRRRQIRLGSYDFEGRHITIARALDRADVPAYVLRQVIYHELLHHDLGVVQGPRRRILHSAEFRRREALTPEFAPAEAWIKAHISQLLKR